MPPTSLPPLWVPALYSDFPPAILHVAVYFCKAPLSVLPTLSLPRCVHKPVLYVCDSIPALQMGSSVPSF